MQANTHIRSKIHALFNTEEGREVLYYFYKKNVVNKKAFENPTMLAAQTSRMDFILSLMNIANVDPSKLLKQDTQGNEE